MLAHWNDGDLYGRMLAARAGAATWILHDGPPYANGRVHMGTALNKILKDFVVRSRSMMGFRTPFVPGWDCHGMPIEFKVSKDLGSKARNLTKLELRRLCHAEAEKWIDIQRKDFMRLGCIGDWFKPYITMDPAYDARGDRRTAQSRRRRLRLSRLAPGALVLCGSNCAGRGRSRVSRSRVAFDLRRFRTQFQRTRRCRRSRPNPPMGPNSRPRTRRASCSPSSGRRPHGRSPPTSASV